MAARTDIETAISAGIECDDDGCVIWTGEVRGKNEYPVVVMPDGDWIAITMFLYPQFKRQGCITVFATECGKGQCLRLDHQQVYAYLEKASAADNRAARRPWPRESLRD